MGREATDEHKRELLKLVCGKSGPWMLLRLPNGMYGAFWYQGFETDHCIAVAEGRYLDALPLIAESRDLVEKYMAENPKDRHLYDD